MSQGAHHRLGSPRIGDRRSPMLDGRLLVDAHLHPARLPTLKAAWHSWAEQFGQPGWRSVFDSDGVVIPRAFDELMESEGVDRAVLLCEYSPKVTGSQPVEDLLLIIKHNPEPVTFLANINPPLHYPVTAELARQAGMGAAALKTLPVPGGLCAADPLLCPAYRACEAEGLLGVVHCGTCSLPC